MKPDIAADIFLIDEGQHEATVLTINEEPNQWYKPGEDPDHRKNRWIWTLSLADGKTIKYFTGTSIGNKKANLTKLVAAVLGKTVSQLTPEDKDDFDTDEAIGKKVSIDVIHQDSEDGSMTFNRVERISPAAASSAKKQGKKSEKPGDVPPETVPF